MFFNTNTPVSPSAVAYVSDVNVLLSVLSPCRLKTQCPVRFYLKNSTLSVHTLFNVDIYQRYTDFSSNKISLPCTS